jgi:aromatic ring-opening dioxygenase catalytic subunit (LigB family)
MPTSISSYKESEDSPGFLLWQLTALWQRKLNTLLKDLDLTHAQFVVLMSAHWLVLRQGHVDSFGSWKPPLYIQYFYTIL